MERGKCTWLASTNSKIIFSVPVPAACQIIRPSIPPLPPSLSQQKRPTQVEPSQGADCIGLSHPSSATQSTLLIRPHYASRSGVMNEHQDDERRVWTLAAFLSNMSHPSPLSIPDTPCNELVIIIIIIIVIIIIVNRHQPTQTKYSWNPRLVCLLCLFWLLCLLCSLCSYPCT